MRERDRKEGRKEEGKERREGKADQYLQKKASGRIGNKLLLTTEQNEIQKEGLELDREGMFDSETEVTREGWGKWQGVGWGGRRRFAIGKWVPRVRVGVKEALWFSREVWGGPGRALCFLPSSCLPVGASGTEGIRDSGVGVGESGEEVVLFS